MSSSGVSMDPRKTKAIAEWPTPKSVHDIQVFLGFCNFYRRFIRNYSVLTQPLTQLLKKDVTFSWSDTLSNALNSIKSAFQSPEMLLHPDETKPFVVETDASDYGVGGILSQYDENNEMHPVAFYSRSLNPAERNYEIYDKELLAIFACFKEWRHFLQGGMHQVTVLTDHKNLQYFMTTKQLTRRQARWSLFFSEFDFVLTYRPGTHSGAPDLLSRRADYVTDSEPTNFIQMIKPEQVIHSHSIEIFNSPSQQMNINAIHSDTLNLDIDTLLDWPLLVAHFLITDTWLTDIDETTLETFCDEE